MNLGKIFGAFIYTFTQYTIQNVLSLLLLLLLDKEIKISFSHVVCLV